MNGFIDLDVQNYVESFYDFKELDSMQSYAEENYVPIVSKDTAMFISFLVNIKKPSNILELGSAIGYSSILMAKSYKETKIDTVERNEDMLALSEKNILKHGLTDGIKVYLSDANDYLKSCKNTYDMIFIDAGKSHYKEYLVNGLKLLKEDGIILCDNVLFKGYIAKDIDIKKHRTTINNLKSFMDYLKEREDLKVSILTVGDGLALIRRK